MEKRLGKIKEWFFGDIDDDRKARIYPIIIGVFCGLGLFLIGEILWIVTHSESTHTINPEVIAYTFTFSLTVMLCAFVLFLCYKSYKNTQVETQKKIDEIKRQMHIQELEDQYGKFIILLNDVLKEIFGDFDETKVSHEFLAKFEEYEKKYNSFLPQSFTEAACLFLALIKCPIVTTDSENEDVKKEVLGLNVRIALGCAIKMIMEPFTYYVNLNGETCLEYYTKVIKVFPDGNSLDGEEGQKILNSVYNDIVENEETRDCNYYEMLFRKIYMNGQKR